MATKPPSQGDGTAPKTGSPPRKGIPRGITKHRLRTLARVFRAANRAGVRWIDIMPDGSIRVVPAGQTPPTSTTLNPWDEPDAADKKRPA
jgi:hypothetical protein